MKKYNNTEIEFEYYKGFYLYPKTSKNIWKEQFLKKLRKKANIHLENMRRIIPFSSYPRIIIIAPSYHKEVKNILEISNYENGISFNNSIMLFLEKEKVHLFSKLFKHEAFHFSVSTLGKEKIIPNWFNEAIAYNISNRTKYQPKELSLLIEKYKDKIYNYFLSDIFFREQMKWINLYKSIGHYFFICFNNKQLKQLFDLLKLSYDFEVAFEKALGISLINFIDKWYYWVVSQKNKTFFWGMVRISYHNKINRS